MAKKQNVQSEQDRVLASLRSMPEPELHTRVIRPLLKQQGASHIDYVHGPTERGKDFIYVRYDSFHDLQRVEVMQVKNAPFSGRSGDNHAITVLSQLIQCRETEVRNPITNAMERPGCVVLLSTYDLPQRDLPGAGRLLDEMKEKNCIFTGPEKVVAKLKQFLPDLYADLAFPGGGVFRAIRRYVNTHHEAGAFDLDPQQRPPLTSFFVNIGVTQTGHLMHRLATGEASPRSPTSVIITTSQFQDLAARYEPLKQMLSSCELFERETSSEPWSTNAGGRGEGDRKAGSKKAAGRGKETMHTRLRCIHFEAFLRAIKTKLVPIQHAPSTAQDSDAVEAIRLITSCDRLIEVLNAALKNEDQLAVDGTWQDPVQFDLPEVSPSALLTMNDNLCIVGEAGAGKTSLARETARIAIERNQKCIYFPCARLDTAAKRLDEEVMAFLRELTGSSENLDPAVLRSARLLILDGLDEAASDPSQLSQEIALLAFPKALREEVTPPAVYGPIVPADLRNSIRYSSGTKSKGVLIQSEPICWADYQRLLYLNSGTVHEGPLTALRDRALSEYPRVIVTTRASHRLENRQTFVEVRLTPFSDEQQQAFFRRWFASSTEKAEAILAFLAANPHIRDVCRTPIVATMVAALHQHGYSLPSSRTDVYIKRFDLLLEKWDRVRGVASRNLVTSRDKMTFLQRIALYLHSKHQRRFTREIALKVWSRGFSQHYPGVQIEDCLWELQACNSLIAPEVGETYSLGHLSYQEFLAARAILHANNLRVLRDKFYDPYWRQVVVFYSGLSGDVSQLLRLVQSDVALSNEGGLLQEVLTEARQTPEYVRASLLDDEFGTDFGFTPDEPEVSAVDADYEEESEDEPETDDVDESEDEEDI